MQSLRAGFAEVDIELVKGMDMTGYIARLSRAEGVHDKLKVKTIIVENGDKRIALVVCDLLGLSAEFIKAASTAIEHHTSIPSENVIVSCIHTHSGPASIFLQNCGEVHNEWLEGLKKSIVSCVKAAEDKIRPVTLSYYTGECDIARNRVIHETDLAERLTDRQLGVLEIKGEESGETEIILVNYACHPVSLPASNLLYSKDYPHYMIESLKKKYGNDVNVIFLNGCCGDINPCIKGSFEAAEELGLRLAESVFETVGKGNSGPITETLLSIKTVSAKVPIAVQLTEEAADILEAEIRSELELAEADGNAVSIKALKAKQSWLFRIREQLKNGTVKNSVEAEMKIIRIGKLVIAALPFEVFHEIGLKIKDFYGKDNTMVIGYTNGDYGYLLSKELYPVSEYEAKKSFIYYGQPGPFSSEAEDAIYRAVLI